MNARVMDSADLKNIATTGSVRRLVRSAERERHVLESQTTELFVSVPRVTLDRLLVNVGQNVTEMLIVPDQGQLATMASVRTLAKD